MTSHATARADHSVILFLRRLWGLALRHIYLHLGSWPRLIEMLYWPIINMLVWGFVSLYLVKRFIGTSVLTDTLIGGVLLTEVFIRVSITMLMLFLEEVWSRNLGHMFASPLKFVDYSIGLIAAALVRTTISIIPAVLIAYWMFGYSLLNLGWPLAGYISLLAMNGCWYGLLIIAMLMRYGLAAEWLAWMSTWLLIPLIAPYYPVSILPDWLQAVSYSLPATHVFESMKSVAAGHAFDGINLLKALALNIIYFLFASWVFTRAYQSARRRGGLLQMGE